MGKLTSGKKQKKGSQNWSIGIDVLCIFTYTLLNYRFTRTFTDHSSVITRCWGFELQNGKRASKAERKQTLAAQSFAPASFLERASLLRKLILRGGLKSRGNRRCAASGGRSEPVSRKRRCLWFSKGHKQQCRDGVHPAKVSPANIPFLADNRKCCIFFVNAKQSKSGHPIWMP